MQGHSVRRLTGQLNMEENGQTAVLKEPKQSFIQMITHHCDSKLRTLPSPLNATMQSAGQKQPPHPLSIEIGS